FRASQPGRDHLARLGYDVQTGGVANSHGIQLDPATGERIGLTEPRNPEWGTRGMAGGGGDGGRTLMKARPLPGSGRAFAAHSTARQSPRPLCMTDYPNALL